MGAPIGLRRRVSAVVVVGAVLVAAGVALLLANAFALRSSSESATRAQTYLLRVADLERLVVDSETGLRGEVITGRTLFLAPLRNAQAQIPAAIAGLRQAASEDHAYEQRSSALIGAVRSYMSAYVPGVLAMAAHDLRGARSFAVTLEGKRRVDAIRTQALQLEHLLAGSQARRQRNARSTADRSILDAIVVLVLLTLLTVAVGGYLARLAVARELAREQSERISRTLQASILPAALPTIPGCELATRFIPGGEVVSGDFYDVLEVETGSWALLIGDVTGKGAAAAATTAMARWTLRSSLTLGAAPAEALRFLNGALLRHDRGGRFITAACLKVVLEPESAHVEIACAGHPAPILVPRVGVPTEVAAEGDMVGLGHDIRLQAAELELWPGDAIVAYTDGVTDQGPEPRLAPEQVLRERSADAGAEQLATTLVDLARPAGSHPDDIAIIALRYLGLGVRDPGPRSSGGVLTSQPVERRS